MGMPRCLHAQTDGVILVRASRMKTKWRRLEEARATLQSAKPKFWSGAQSPP